jgi:hypothetical protein
VAQVVEHLPSKHKDPQFVPKVNQSAPNRGTLQDDSSCFRHPLTSTQKNSWLKELLPGRLQVEIIHFHHFF